MQNNAINLNKGKTYELRIIFRNDTGDDVYINPQSIIDINIENDREFGDSGYFTLSNNSESIFKKVILDEKTAGLVSNNNFQLRNDGKDRVSIMIGINDIDNGGDSNVGSNPKWILNIEAFVYETRDLTSSGSSDSSIIKAKQFFFKDCLTQYLEESYLDWTTLDIDSEILELYGFEIDPIERKAPTGICILDIIKKVIDNTSEFTDNFRMEFKVDLEEIVEEFDEGANTIFLSSSEDTSALDLIRYIMKRHVSKETHMPCDIIFEYNIDNIKIHTGHNNLTVSLIPLDDIFEKSTEGNGPGEYYSEGFLISDKGQSETPFDAVSYGPPVPKQKIEEVIGLSFFGENDIVDYSFIDMAGEDNSQIFKSDFVHSYDPITGEFIIDCHDSNILNTRKTIRENLLDKLYKTQSELGVLLVLDDFKTTNKNVHNKYIGNNLDLDLLGKISNAEKIKAFLNLNQMIYFDVLGMPYRRSGRFIVIDSEVNNDNIDDNHFLYKLLGQWYITTVFHNYSNGIYTNRIFAVKIQSFRDHKISDTLKY